MSNWKQAFKHWMSNTKIYNVWKQVKVRCYNKNSSRYSSYWARWIIVSSEWHDFQNFYRDMWPTYKEGLTLDRTDNNWNYCKENCRWVTYKEQMRNTRRTLLYKWKCAKDWCMELWINYSTFTTRIYKGKTLKEALELI